MAEFLATAPPDLSSEIDDLWMKSEHNNLVKTPDVLLHCDSEKCGGSRSFQKTLGSVLIKPEVWNFEFLTFSCRNCRERSKTYAVALKTQSNSPTNGRTVKLGETPPFGPHVPARVISLIGPDLELFLQGRRAENRAMGIGAFSYYRRVVENQKNRIIEQISKVAGKLGAKPEMLEEFAAAMKETQFSKSMEQIKHGIPDVLLINGQHNPLTLLHSALSEGLHADTDRECLEIAQEIRLVLTELADRISQALKQEDELAKAVSRLLTRKSAKSSLPEK